MSYITDRFDDEVVRLLKSGAVGLLPSDTIYGLSCLALDRQAVEKVHEIKRRDKTKPFVILVSSTAQAEELGITSSDIELALDYWPGKLTIICGAPNSPAWLHMGTLSLAIRQPASEALRQLITKVGPIISTSVNLSGKQPAASFTGAEKYFGDKLDFYVDAGELTGKPSTIVKANSGKLEVIRQGAVKIN